MPSCGRDELIQLRFFQLYDSYSSGFALNLQKSYTVKSSPHFFPFICKVLTGTLVHNFLLYTFSQS